MVFLIHSLICLILGQNLTVPEKASKSIWNRQAVQSTCDSYYSELETDFSSHPIIFVLYSLLGFVLSKDSQL